jgi:hypothetical protein
MKIPCDMRPLAGQVLLQIRSELQSGGSSAHRVLYMCAFFSLGAMALRWTS